MTKLIELLELILSSDQNFWYTLILITVILFMLFEGTCDIIKALSGTQRRNKNKTKSTKSDPKSKDSLKDYSKSTVDDREE